MQKILFFIFASVLLVKCSRKNDQNKLSEKYIISSQRLSGQCEMDLIKILNKVFPKTNFLAVYKLQIKLDPLLYDSGFSSYRNYVGFLDDKDSLRVLKLNLEFGEIHRCMPNEEETALIVMNTSYFKIDLSDLKGTNCIPIENSIIPDKISQEQTGIWSVDHSTYFYGTWESYYDQPKEVENGLFSNTWTLSPDTTFSIKTSDDSLIYDGTYSLSHDSLILKTKNEQFSYYLLSFEKEKMALTTFKKKKIFYLIKK